jgi:methyl-accepting chemotaxis protein
MKLRTKLVITFSIITLIPALITGMYAIQVSSNSLRTQALTTQTARAQTLVNNVHSFLSVVKGDVLFLSQSPVMTEYATLRFKNTPDDILEQKRQFLEQEFLALSQNRGIYYQVRYLDEKGQEVVRVDSDGFKHTIIARDKLQDKSGRYYFKDAIRLWGTQLFVSPLDLNREHGAIEIPHKPVIRYGVNVYDDKNNKAGIVLVNVDAKKFLKPLAQIRLVDQNGYFMSHPEIKKRWGGPTDLNTNERLQKEYGELSKKILGKNGTISTDKITLSYQRLKVPGVAYQWTLIIQDDTDEILNSVKKFRAIFSLILLLAILFALFLAWFFSRIITRPLEHLTEAAENISKGELHSNKIEFTDDKSEIGQLARAFERMRVSMIKSFERLRKQSKV